ncbi:Phosphoribosylformylglycinamidine cyclo-ligase [Maioricimonas rarisocia]|uniref:Phosphoribosylformylglycinamidine cyclo-ligase n=1 Tax=Maioricimonas rarisocia TaxID=2528026 RepID=A0A517Z1D1_9PLAN|nr:phosphoribosylformylglycinamidine cyclo-ligase [Maioricimonas rarisocia]QDU36282.1 Phosphoribosylformylglycinamidine cyclo-ligase [Maioricimonas rarisocia]
MSSLSYKDAGVDLDQYAEAMDRLPALMRQTHSPRVMPLAGGFAGLFQLQGAGHDYEDPVLVSGTDGVGTKLKVAIQAKRFDTVGIDLVAMCVNDCLCLGAEPLFFLDYLALDRDDPERIAALVKGVTDGCLQAGAALLGGETAIMPGVYAEGDFDMAGFCVGVVEKKDILDGSQVQAGDVLLGIPSSGLHSNGYSLVRKIVFEHAGLKIDETVQELDATVGEVLLTPTRIYADIVSTVRKDADLRSQVTAIAHITGGGLAENLGRVMPEGVRAQIQLGSWKVPPVFGWLAGLGNVAEEEMLRVFNMGIGLVLAVRPAAVDAVRSAVGADAVVLGTAVAGETGAEYLPA